MKKIFHTIFMSIIICQVATSSESTIWDRKFNIEKLLININKDVYQNEKEILKSLVFSRIPLNIEYTVHDMENDVITKKIGNEERAIMKPRNTPINLIDDKVKTVNLLDIVNHFVQQMDDYVLQNTNNRICIIPKNKPISKEIKISPIKLENILIAELFLDHIKDKRFTIRGFSRYNTRSLIDMRFNIDFSGGDLSDFLTEVCNSLETSEPTCIYCWTIVTYKNSDGVFISFPPINKKELEANLMD